MKRQSFLIILCACVCVLDTGAQTRLSVLPWHERDSIVAAKAEADVYTDIPDKQPFFLVYQEDNDRYSMKWICDYYDKKGNIHNDSSMIRAFAPSDRYCYSVSVIGETFYPDHEIVQMANVELDEDLNVIFSEATGDVTVYSYGIDENERVTGVFENPTRHAQRYAIPTDAQLRSREYAKGKPIWKMKKDERIRILTAIALNHMAYHMKEKDIPIDIHNHGDMFPTIGEYPFKFIGYSWIPEKYLPVTTDEIPGWVRADDILHVVTIYYKEWQTAGLPSPELAKLYITDRKRKVIRCEVAVRDADEPYTKVKE